MYEEFAEYEQEFDELYKSHESLRDKCKKVMSLIGSDNKLVKAWVALDAVSMIYDAQVHIVQDEESGTILAHRNLKPHEEALHEAACSYLFYFLADKHDQADREDSSSD